MIAAIVVLATTTLGLPLIVLKAWQAERKELLWLLASMADQATDERRSLLNRIEPSTAQYVAQEQVEDETRIVDLDNDEWFKDLSKEELAEALVAP